MAMVRGGIVFSLYRPQEAPHMITTTTTTPDAYGYGRVFEIAEHVYQDADTGILFITDGQNTIAVRVTDPAAQE